jgi:thiosulfate reductase cytochrome b subunit
MSDRIYLYPLVIRIWHVLNAIFILGLIITGASMQAMGSRLEFIDFKLAVKIHDISGILLSVNYLLFLLANIRTRNTRHYFYKSVGFVKNMGTQLRYYLFGIFKNEKHPFPPNEQRKFNPLQQFSYVIVMYFFVPLMILTGLAFLFPNVIFDRILGMPGIFLNDIIHVLTGFFCTIFLFIHLYFCTIGDTFTSNFKSMITGWHKVHHK